MTAPGASPSAVPTAIRLPSPIGTAGLKRRWPVADVGAMREPEDLLRRQALAEDAGVDEDIGRLQ